MSNTKSSLIMCNSSNDEEMKKRKRLTTDDDDHLQYPHIPQEIIVDGILPRLPVNALSRFSCVSKSWNDMISHDPKFASSHFIQSQKKSYLCFNVLNQTDNDSGHKSLYGNYIFSLDDGDSSNGDYLEPTQILSSNIQGSAELIGYCNGLRCIKMQGGSTRKTIKDTVIVVLNPSRKEYLGIPSPLILKEYLGPIIGYGFGFDPLRKEYKLVYLYYIAMEGFVCSVFALGTNSWRTINISNADILPHGCSPITSRLVICPASKINRPAIWRSGDLFWSVTTVTNDQAGNRTMGKMLLSLDLHNEKFQLMEFPTAEDQRYYQVADELIEYKGSICVASIEKVLVTTTDQHNHRHCHSNGCCCCCKIHLCVLNDKDNQIWSTETFNVHINSTTSTTSASAPCCGYFCTNTMRRTRITSFSDRVLLYWFDGGNLQYYDVQTKQLSKAVTCFRTGDQTRSTVSRSLMNIPLLSNYQLHGGQGENFLSLRAFVPEGEPTIFYGQNTLPRCMKRSREALAGCVFQGFITNCMDRQQLWHSKVWVDSASVKKSTVSKRTKKCQCLRDVKLSRLWVLESNIRRHTEIFHWMLDISKGKLNTISNMYAGAQKVVATKGTSGGSATSCDKCKAIDIKFVTALRQIKLDFERYIVQLGTMEQLSRAREKWISTIDKSIENMMSSKRKDVVGSKSLCEISIEINTELQKVKASLLTSKIEISQMEEQMSKESLIKIREFVGRMKSNGSSRCSCEAGEFCNLIVLDFLTELVTLECFTDKAHSSALEKQGDWIISSIDEIIARNEFLYNEQ